MGGVGFGRVRALVDRALRGSLAAVTRVVGVVGVLVVLLGVVLAVVPPVASAEALCTDTWSGPSEGSWTTAEDWSSGKVPGSADVACIAAGKTVKVTGGTNQAGVLLDEGTVVLSGGSLELVSASEVSSAYALTVDGGTLKGAGTVDVFSSFVGGEFGTMTGTGSTVIEPGGTGMISANSSWSLEISERTLRNEGTLTVAKGAGLIGADKAKLINTGTLVVNGESAGENHGVIAGAGGGGVLVNTGVLKKTEGSGTTAIGFEIENDGSVSTTSGVLELTGGGASGELVPGSWSASGAGTAIRFHANTPGFGLGWVVPMSGTIEVIGCTVSAGTIEGSGASLSVVEGAREAQATTLEVDGLSTSTLHALSITGRSVRDGSGQLDVAGSFAGGGYGVLAGTGSTVIGPSGTGMISANSSWSLEIAEAAVLSNEGTLTVAKGAGILGNDLGMLTNSGTLIVNGESAGENHGLIKGPVGNGRLVNTGVLQKTEGSALTPIQFYSENLGVIEAQTGGFDFSYAEYFDEEEGWGEVNPSAANQELPPECGEGVDCATGNLSETQTDFAIGGRGVGLDLTRTYNSQAAAKGVLGIFGYGWSNSFGDHLVVEEATKKTVLYQANGSTVPFAEGSGGVFTAPEWSQDILTGTKAAGYSLTLEDQTVYKFAGATGRLESVTDRNGNATTLTYNGSGQLTTITDPASRTIKLVYNGEGLVESAEDPMKHVVKYTYKEKQLASVTQPGEAALRWQFAYDGSHQLTELTDGRGNKSINEYTNHQVTKQIDNLKRETTFEYEPFFTKTKNVATGAVTLEGFTSNGQADAITRGYGTSLATTEIRRYNSAGDLTSVTDGDGHTTKYGYDSHSNRTSMVDPERNETKWTYDSTHDIETETKPNGETTTYKLEGHGNPEVIERPAPGGKTQITKYKYGSHGEMESMTDPLERTWKYEYDSAGDKTAEIDPEGDKRTWGYNEDSQETSMVSPRGHVAGAKESEFKTTTEVNAQGRPIKVTDPLGHETKYTYDGNGNLETVTDPESHKTTYTYDADNERTKVEEPNKTITETEYDGAGQIKKQIDGDKHATEYVRNVLEQVTEVIDPLSRKTLKEYDRAGNLVSVTDAAKRTTAYKYDADNRLTEITYSDGKTPTVKYEYNADGDRTKMVDGSGTTTYEYDQLDRLTATKDGHGNTVGYEYDLANEQTKITYPNGKVVEREYDKAGRLKSTTDWSKNVVKFTYDADSDLTATTFPSGTSDEDTYKYDDSDAITEVKMKKSTETLASLAYTRNKDELVETTTSKGLPGEEKPAYTYDKNNRLTKGAGIPYEYDAANNPTTIGTEHTYSYNAADELEKSVLKKATAATYTYNEVGERTKTEPASGSATTYGYDQAGNLISVARPKGTEAAIEDSYGYNGDGLRTSETISGTTTYLAWDLAEKLPVILNDGTNSYIYGPGGLPVEQINNGTGTVLYLHHDQQGSTRLLTGSTGKTEATFTYDAYGNLTGKTGTVTSPLGYDSQYTNADTGLIYLRARSYDPVTAQFLSVDPKAETTGAIYGYAENDPLTNEDPTGECKQVNVAKTASGELKHCGKDGRQLTVDFKTIYCNEGGCEINYRAKGVVAGAPRGIAIEQHFKITAHNPAWSSNETIEEHKGVKNITTPSYLGNSYLPYDTTYTFELTIHEGTEEETLEVRLEAAAG